MCDHLGRPEILRFHHPGSSSTGNTQAWTGTPVFSPDGKLVAFPSAKNDTVTLMDVATGKVTQLSTRSRPPLATYLFSDGKNHGDYFSETTPIILWVSPPADPFHFNGHTEYAILTVFSRMARRSPPLV